MRFPARAAALAMLAVLMPAALPAVMMAQSSVEQAVRQLRDRDVPVHEVGCDLQLVGEGDAVRFDGRIACPPVDAGRRVGFLVTLFNPTDRDFPFARINLGCICVRAVCDGDLVPSGGALRFLLDYDLPKTGASRHHQLLVGFSNRENREAGSVIFEGELRGVLGIRSPGVLESTGVLSEWELPVVYSAPVDPGRLEVAMPESLRDLVGSVRVEGENATLVISGPESVLGNTGIAGDVVVRDPLLKVAATIRLTFVRQSVVQFSPQLLRFRREEGREGRYVSRALVRLKQKPVQDGEPESPNTLTGVSFDAGGFDLSIAASQLSGSVHCLNLTLQLEEEQIRSKVREFPVQWTIQTAGGQESFRSIAMLPED